MSQLPDLSESLERQGRLALPLLLAAAFVIKVIVLVQLGDHPLLQPQGQLDGLYYVELARKVAAGGPLALGEAFFVSPLYVYLLALVSALAGISPRRGWCRSRSARPPSAFST